MAKNLSVADIHHELCTVYGQNVMSEGVVCQCVCLKVGEQTLTMKKGVAGHL